MISLINMTALIINIANHTNLIILVENMIMHQNNTIHMINNMENIQITIIRIIVMNNPITQNRIQIKAAINVINIKAIMNTAIRNIDQTSTDHSNKNRRYTFKFIRGNSQNVKMSRMHNNLEIKVLLSKTQLQKNRMNRQRTITLNSNRI